MWGDQRNPSAGESGQGSDSDPPAGDGQHREVLDCLGDEVSRSILAAAAEAPQSAADLADRCDVSRSTVYRRLNRLVDLGLVDELPRTDVDARAGSSVFRTAAGRLYVDVSTDGLRVGTEDPEPPAVRENTVSGAEAQQVETETGPMVELSLRVPAEYADRLLSEWAVDQMLGEDLTPQTSDETA